MLSAEQIRKLVSINESLQLQLEDANAVLAAREEEIELLGARLAGSTAMRSKMDSQLDEIESFQYLLFKKERQAEGAAEREIALQRELTDLARLNIMYNELVRDHAYLSSRFSDVQAGLTEANERNFELQQVAAKNGELRSILESLRIERDGLKDRVAALETEKYSRAFNL